MSIALAAMSETFIQAANAAHIPLEVLHRVASMASGGMDTLPHNGAVITLLAVTGLTHRTSYKDIFAITVHQDDRGVRRDRCVLSLRHRLITQRPPDAPRQAIENRSSRLECKTGNSMNATNVADLVAALHTFEHGKVVSAREAVALIRTATRSPPSGFVGIGFAENIAVALENRFVDSAKDDPDGVGSPRDLTLVYAAGQGDGKERGLNHLGHARPREARDRRPLGPRAEAAGSSRSATRSRPTTCRRA